MTVNEFITQLQQLPGDAQLYFQNMNDDWPRKAGLIQHEGNNNSVVLSIYDEYEATQIKNQTFNEPERIVTWPGKEMIKEIINQFEQLEKDGYHVVSLRLMNPNNDWEDFTHLLNGKKIGIVAEKDNSLTD